VFVKFDTNDAATEALGEANSRNFGAEWARRNLDLEAEATGPRTSRGEAPRGDSRARSESFDAAPRRRGRDAAPPPEPGGGDINTITIQKLRDKEHDFGKLKRWFSDSPGFVRLKYNKGIDAVFVKFESRRAAEEALEEANEYHFGAEWARRNLESKTEDDKDNDTGEDYSHRVPSGGRAARPASSEPPSASPSPNPQRRRGRTPPASGDIDTITIQALSKKEFDLDKLQSWFRKCPNFVGLNHNKSIDALFVKFTSQAAAEKALNHANWRHQFGVEFARRNLNIPSAA
jgi:hypothetical protein